MVRKAVFLIKKNLGTKVYTKTNFLIFLTLARYVSTYTKFDNQWVFVAYFNNCTTLVITLKFEYDLCEIVVGHNTNMRCGNI